MHAHARQCCGQSLASARLCVSEVRHKRKLAAIDYDVALKQDRDEKVQVVLKLRKHLLPNVNSSKRVHEFSESSEQGFTIFSRIMESFPLVFAFGL